MDTHSQELATNGHRESLKVDEFAAAFAISARSVKRLIAKKQVRSYKIGRLVRIPLSELHDFPTRRLEEAET